MNFKFKIGDEVRILDREFSHGFDVGEIVIIIENKTYSTYHKSYYYQCKSKEYMGVTWYVLESSMELVPPKFILPEELFEI